MTRHPPTVGPAMRHGRRWIAAAGAVLVFTACSSSDRGADPGSASGTEPTAGTTPDMAADPRPFLLTAGISYMPVWFRQPKDLPSVAVWEDGRVVLVDLAVADFDDAHYEVSTVDLDEDAVDRIRAAIEDARLVSAGDRGQILAPGVVDGGATILATRHGDDRSVVVIDQPGDVEDPTTPRREYEAVLTTMRTEIEKAGEAIRVPLDRWTVSVGDGRKPQGALAIDGRDVPGTSRAIRNAEWTQAATGVWCAILTMEPPPLARSDQRTVLDGRSATVRPLLPGESDCEAGRTLAALLQHGPLAPRMD